MIPLSPFAVKLPTGHHCRFLVLNVFVADCLKNYFPAIMLEFPKATKVDVCSV